MPDCCIENEVFKLAAICKPRFIMTFLCIENTFDVGVITWFTRICPIPSQFIQRLAEVTRFPQKLPHRFGNVTPDEPIRIPGKVSEHLVPPQLDPELFMNIKCHTLWRVFSTLTAKVARKRHPWDFMRAITKIFLAYLITGDLLNWFFVAAPCKSLCPPVNAFSVFVVGERFRRFINNGASFWVLTFIFHSHVKKSLLDLFSVCRAITLPMVTNCQDRTNCPLQTLNRGFGRLRKLESSNTKGLWGSKKNA